MASKHIFLSINPSLYAALEKKAKANMMSVNELITDTMRRSVLAQKSGKSPKSGDPIMDYFSRPKTKKK